MELTADNIRQLLLNKNGDLNVRAANRYKHMFEKSSLYHQTSSYSEIAYLVLNPNVTRVCVCGKPLLFKTFRSGYRTACSQKCASKSQDRALKSRSTILQKYHDNETYNKVRASKAAKTSEQRYGVKHFQQTQQQRDKVKKWKTLQIPQREWIVDQYITQQKTMQEIANQLSISDLTVAKWIKQYEIPQRENYISRHSNLEKTFAKNFTNIQYVIGDRKQIYPYEIDIYFPQFNVGVEINGLYWHSENLTNRIDRNQHVNKTLLCHSKGIRLFTIFEHELRDETKKQIWISMINNSLNQTPTKIGARQCEIWEITSSEARKFFKENHVRGFASGSRYLGLTFKGKIVAAAVFGKGRFNKTFVELIRFGVVKNTNVVGALSRIIKHSGYNDIISYCDLTYGTGKSYQLCGFKKINTTTPSYFYYKGTRILSRYQAQKHRLLKTLDKYDQTLTEFENMSNNNYRRVWDCGHIVFTRSII
jgi:hypothetical protein